MRSRSLFRASWPGSSAVRCTTFTRLGAPGRGERARAQLALRPACLAAWLPAAASSAAFPPRRAAASQASQPLRCAFASRGALSPPSLASLARLLSISDAGERRRRAGGWERQPYGAEAASNGRRLAGRHPSRGGLRPGRSLAAELGRLLGPGRQWLAGSLAEGGRRGCPTVSTSGRFVWGGCRLTREGGAARRQLSCSAFLGISGGRRRADLQEGRGASLLLLPDLVVCWGRNENSPGGTRSAFPPVRSAFRRCLRPVRAASGAV